TGSESTGHWERSAWKEHDRAHVERATSDPATHNNASVPLKFCAFSSRVSQLGTSQHTNRGYRFEAERRKARTGGCVRLAPISQS
ncbi:hypothetical protein DENSPDRAFT_843805, partial [Dentipellis sp. KUC8613]